MRDEHPISDALSQIVRGLRILGSGPSLQAALYPLRKAYHEARFSGGNTQGSLWRGLSGMWAALRPPVEPSLDPGRFTFAGDVLSYQHQRQTLTLLCENASLQISVLAADVVRVRLSRSRFFPTPESYAIAKADAEWPPARHSVEETGGAIELRTEGMTCHIDRHPLRVSFWDRHGNCIHTDHQGLAWQGNRIVRYARLEPDEHIYGLGEKALPLDRRGRSLSIWNTDPQHYEPGADPIYVNVPFYLALCHGVAYGLYYDNSYRAQFDLGLTRPDTAIYTADDGEMRYYFFYGPEPDHVMERYTELTGRLPLPPMWALGYHQSRWSYCPAQRVREVARLFREHQIPCDVLHLDIHYMDGYRCFTWDAHRFPDPASLIEELHQQGFKVVLLIDCGIKADSKYHVCAAGLAEEMFCSYPDGTVAAGPVWPGESYFPDFTSPRVRHWWGQLHEPLVEAGVDGIWDDMNEPSVFGPRSDTLADCTRHDCEGRGTDHREAHNVYGFQMARATHEGLQRLRPTERPFVLTRSGWAGVQRYAASWTGDNASSWEHLRLSMPMVIGLGLSGLAFAGADVGGFSGDADAELLTRWTQLGVFLPLFRNHTAMLTRDQEPWAHGEPYVSANRAAIQLRYQLLPYLYTATWQCSQSGRPITAPLLWADPADERAHGCDDQFLCGDSLLVAPVCEPGATSRQLYLPRGSWFDFWTDELHLGPTTLHTAASLDRIPLFVRAGTVLPLWPVRQHTAQPVDSLILHVYPGHEQSWLYEDDGHSLNYQRGWYRATRFECTQTKDALTIVSTARGDYQPESGVWQWHIHAASRSPKQVVADGQNVPHCSFDEVRRTLRFTTQEKRRVDVLL